MPEAASAFFAVFECAKIVSKYSCNTCTLFTRYLNTIGTSIGGFKFDLRSSLLTLGIAQAEFGSSLA